MTEQEKIIDAANKYCACGIEKNCVHKTAFYMGADYYAKEVMPGMLEKLLVWFGCTYECYGQEGWVDKHNRLYSTKQLLEMFFQRLKQKQDAGV